MKKKLTILLLLPFVAFTQNNRLKKAFDAFDEENYIKSISILERLSKKGDISAEIYSKLGDANYFNANYEEANKWYTNLYNLNPNMDAEYNYRFSQTLKSSGLLEESKKQMQLFLNKRPNENRTSLHKNSKLSSKFSFFNINKLSLNSVSSDYGATMKGDSIIFSSARDYTLDNKNYPRTEQSYSSLFYSVRQSDSTYSKPRLFSKGSFSIYHESTPSFSSNGKTMYYTQNLLDKSSKIKLKNGLFGVYKSINIKGKWKNQGVIKLSEDDFVNIAHPSLSKDGKYLYFSANLKESYGLSDIFRVEINPDGSFNKVEHLDHKINTEGRETYPHITNENTLFFSSDGHDGYGGLDLYSIDLNNPDAVAINLGNIINSAYDDFALVTNINMTEGLFTTNRPELTDDDDIFTFSMSSLPIDFYGSIVDDLSKLPIHNAKISIFDNKNNLKSSQVTDSLGNFIFRKIIRDSKYYVKIEVNKYKIFNSEVSIYKNDLNKTFEISKDTMEIDISSMLNPNIIYFDVDDYKIRKDAELELDKIVSILKNNPNLSIIIESHTDSRESKYYNMKLSQQRADATAKYLILKGVEKSRLITKGLGESQLINNCQDGVKCSEEQHQLNRRSVFRLAQ